MNGPREKKMSDDALNVNPTIGIGKKKKIKLCECGCGQPAPIAKYNCRSLGYIKGESVRFIQGHHNKLKNYKGKNHPMWNGGLKKDGSFRIIILGVGINVNIDNKTLSELDNMATSIEKILGKTADRELIMAKILDNFERSYNYFSTTGDFKSLFVKWEKNIRY